jgi:hypothetical protein
MNQWLRQQIKLQRWDFNAFHQIFIEAKLHKIEKYHFILEYFRKLDIYYQDLIGKELLKTLKEQPNT